MSRHSDSEGNILVVGHGGSLRGLIASMMGMPAEYMWRLRLSNCSITIINTFDGGSALDLLNDTSHLEDVIRNVFAKGW